MLREMGYDPDSATQFRYIYGKLIFTEEVLIYKQNLFQQYVPPGGVCLHSCRTNHVYTHSFYIEVVTILRRRSYIHELRIYCCGSRTKTWNHSRGKHLDKIILGTNSIYRRRQGTEYIKVGLFSLVISVIFWLWTLQLLLAISIRRKDGMIQIACLWS